MALARTPIVAFLMRYAQRLRFPTLFVIAASLFLVDLVVPDVIPFGDEILLGLGTTLLATLKKRVDDRTEKEEPA